MAQEIPDSRELEGVPRTPWYFRRWFILVVAVFLGLSGYIAWELHVESEYQKRIQQGGFGPAQHD